MAAWIGKEPRTNDSMADPSLVATYLGAKCSGLPRQSLLSSGSYLVRYLPSILGRCCPGLRCRNSGRHHWYPKPWLWRHSRRFHSAPDLRSLRTSVPTPGRYLRPSRRGKHTTLSHRGSGETMGRKVPCLLIDEVGSQLPGEPRACYRSFYPAKDVNPRRKKQWRALLSNGYFLPAHGSSDSISR